MTAAVQTLGSTTRRVALPAPRRFVGAITLVLLGGALVTLAFVVGLIAAGDRLLVVGSGSMAPAIEAGDLVVVRPVSIADVKAGDVVTFHDPNRDGELVTHRVVAKEADGDLVHVTTKGDANRAAEDWWMAADGEVGRLRAHVPGAGRIAAMIVGPLGLTAALVVALAAAGWSTVRRVRSA